MRSSPFIHRRFGWATLLLSVGLLGGCGEWYLSTGSFCVSDSGWRVRLFVVDSFGVGIGNARVVYTLDSGPGDTLVCDSTGYCDWVVNRQGLLTISVVSLGYGPGAAQIRLSGDPCRVVPPRTTVYLTRL